MATTSAPKEVIELVERFDRNRDSYLAGGINETKTYYKTIAELGQMGGGAMDKRLRVAGDVEPGSIFLSVSGGLSGAEQTCTRLRYL